MKLSIRFSNTFLVLLIVITPHYSIALPHRGPFVRPDKGPAITESERKVATEEFLALLKDTRYFDFVDSRTHGTPENNSTNTFWWGNMWTGVKVAKKNGQVTFTHQNNGSDNVGIHTSPYLEGACYAYRLTGDPRYAHLARKLIRGFSSWILSSSRSATDSPKVLSRSFYPASFSSNDGGRNLVVDYSASRPGIRTEAADYVHVPSNPYFGDLWVKNNRSIDDIGQMIRGMAQIQVCRYIFDADTRADLDQMNTLYAAWGKSVDQSNFVIPTFNAKAEIYLPKGEIGDFNKYSQLGFDPNCAGKLAVRFLHLNEPKSLSCDNGISALERVLEKRLGNDAIEILRSHHVSSIAMAELKAQPDIAFKLRQGLAVRLDHDLVVAKNPKDYPLLDIQDIPAEFVHANNVGVPLTSEEIRFVYQRLHTAYIGMRSAQYFQTFNLFDAVVPDGEYSYDAPNIGLYFYTLAPMLGACSSAWVQTTTRPLWDCAKVQAALRPLGGIQ